MALACFYHVKRPNTSFVLGRFVRSIRASVGLSSLKGTSNRFALHVTAITFARADYKICSACAFTLICLGPKICVTTPASSVMKVVRKTPIYVRPAIFFSP